MKYLDYSEIDPILHIKVPIFQNINDHCEIQSTFRYIEGQEWIRSIKGNNFFSLEYHKINGTGELKVNNFSMWNEFIVSLKLSYETL